MPVSAGGIADEVLETDVLIIGGGLAGSLAAIKAKESGLDVTIVEKANVGRSGISHQMNGVLTCFDPEEDDRDKWYRECVEAGEGLVDQHRLEGMIEESGQRIRDLDEWGVGFQMENGKFLRKPGAGHQYLRNVIMVQGAFQLMSVLRGEVLRRGVRLVERVAATDLLTSDGQSPTGGRVTGAVGFGIHSGKFYAFRSRATVIAAGAARDILSTHPMPSQSGDGKGMAFRCGAEIRNAEFARIGPTATGLGVLGANMLFGEGAFLVNALGERFMLKWDPVRAERAPKGVMGRAISTEELEGRGPVYLDATHLGEAAHQRIEMAAMITVRVLAKGGLSFRKDRIQWTTQLSEHGAGGIRVDRLNGTTLPGLYAAGSVSDHGEDGVCNVMTHGIESAIGGHRAGKAASEWALQMDRPVVDVGQLRRLRERAFAPQQVEGGTDDRAVRTQCRRLWGEGLLGPTRNEKRLREAIQLAQELRIERVPNLVARDCHELVKVLGLSNQLLFAEVLARCALHRTESRGSHYREDYPKRDDADWLKWVIARNVDGEINVYDEAVPNHEYPIKPGLPSRSEGCRGE